MPGHECYHCKQWIEEDEAHDCWTTTEAALTRDLSEQLRDAWERIRQAAASFGDQRIYASHHCIMFSRKACYFFVRPKRNVLEMCIFLGRAIKAPQVRRSDAASRVKVATILHITHRDEVEAPITDWMREAYEGSDALSVSKTARVKARKAATRRATSRQTGTKAKRTTAKKSSRKGGKRRGASRRAPSR